MEVRAARRREEIDDHWSLDDKSNTITDGKLGDEVAQALGSNEASFQIVKDEISRRKQEIWQYLKQTEGMHGDIVRLKRDMSPEIAKEEESMEAAIREAESELAAASEADEGAQKELREVSAEKERIFEAYNQLVAKLPKCDKKARQKLNDKKRLLDPQKSKILDLHSATVKAAGASALRLHHATANLDALKRRKESLAELPEKNRERAATLQQKLTAAHARIIELQQGLDRYIDELLVASSKSEDEEFRTQAQFFFRSI